MENWLANNALELAVLVIGGIIGFVKLSRFQDDANKWRGEFGKTISEIKQAFDRHVEAPTPHSSCPAHAAILNEIRSVLRSIDQRITAVDDRMFGKINDLEKRLFDLLHEQVKK